MSTRPKTQESPLKSKSTIQQGDLRNRSISNSSPLNQPDKAVAEISMKDFLDFLKISYQVNEAIDNSSEISEKGNVDWKKLTSDALINRLKEREAVFKEKAAKIKLESQEKPKNSDTDLSPPAETQSGSGSASKNAARPISEEKGSENKLTGDETDLHPSPEKTVSGLSLDRKVSSEKLKRTGFNRKKALASKKDGSGESETSGSFEGTGEERAPSKLLKKKLNEVLQEGILDSVLPYLIPRHQQPTQDNPHLLQKKTLPLNDVKKNMIGNSDKSEKLPGHSIKEKLDLRRKSFPKTDPLLKHEKKDVEVVIHVCDEIKNLKRDFKCSQRLLISQMGYFAEVTTGQKLEDMDISVHCDVTIFDWLMRWVQKDALSEEHWPMLDSSIVIPVLMSSAFLQMNSLQEHCLHYCKTHINDIIRDSPNLSCINDNVLTRLANLFSNVEIESIIDKKDKIQSKLFCKLITALTEPEPQPERGHYSSVATIYRCSKCIKLILRNMSGSILCVPGNMTMDRNGSVHSTHVYDSSWNLTDYVRDLKAELKTWRKVYWRLWADCHLLFCQACEEHFPIHHMNWCRYHVESVQYFSLENQRSMTYPIGRYSCCGEKAYRFEVIKKISGCHYRDHVTNPKTTRDAEVFQIWNAHKEIIRENPPPLPPPEKVKFIKQSREDGGVKKSPVKDNHWWEGLELVPSKQPAGLLTKFWDTIIKKDDSKTAGNSENKYQKSPVTKVVATPQPSVQDVSSLSDSSDESCSSSNAGNSEESYHSTTKIVPKTKNQPTGHNLTSARLSHIRAEKKRRKKKKKKKVVVRHDGNRFWVSKLSTRCNQDNQREFEERALRQIESVLAKKLSGETFRSGGTRSSYQVVPAGGIYVKLEQEWREAHCFSHGCPGSSIKARGSASYINVNNSNFAVNKRSKSKGHRS